MKAVIQAWIKFKEWHNEHEICAPGMNAIHGMSFCAWNLCSKHEFGSWKDILCMKSVFQAWIQFKEWHSVQESCALGMNSIQGMTFCAWKLCSRHEFHSCMPFCAWMLVFQAWITFKECYYVCMKAMLQAWIPFMELHSAHVSWTPSMNSIHEMTFWGTKTNSGHWQKIIT